MFVSVKKSFDLGLFTASYQSLSFSYLNLINNSPATSLKIFLCSSVKCFFHSPVFPERKVGDLVGLMDDSRESENQLSGRLKRPAKNSGICEDTGQEVVDDAVQCLDPVIDQIFEVNSSTLEADPANPNTERSVRRCSGIRYPDLVVPKY